MTFNPEDHTIDLQVIYNNGDKIVTDTFAGQKAGTVTGTAKAADGYKITGINSAYYSFVGVKSTLDNFKATKISDQEYSYSFDLTNDNINDLNSHGLKVELDVTTDEIPVPFDIDISKLVNCTVSPTKIMPDQETDLTITANDGYILNGSGNYLVDDYESNDFKCNNVQSYKITGVTAEISVVITFTATKVEPVEPSIDLQVTYDNGLTNFTDTFTGQKAGTIKGTVKAATGYAITGVIDAYYNIAGMLTHLTNFNTTKISDYEYSYSFDLTNDDINNLGRFKTPIELRVDTKKQAGNINIDTSKLINCSVSPATITQGQQTTLTLNANTGFILNGTGTYTIDGSTSNFTCNNVSSYQITTTANTSVSITFTATKAENIKPSTIVHTYILDQDNYNNLGKQIVTGSSTTDYTEFIEYLYQLPFEIGTDITTSSSSINLGRQNLSINCRTVTHETLDIDLGSIDLTGVSNSHDLKPINTTLYCPFSENIVLPATVIGSKLYLSFTINLKTEQGLLLIKQNDNIIYSGQTELFTDLPLYFTAGKNDSIVRRIKAQYQNSIDQAYIVVNYNKAITDLTSYKTNEHGTLSNYRGFTRVTHGTLKQSVNSSIDNSLLTLLKQGVIIK